MTDTAKLIEFNPLHATSVLLPPGATFVVANCLAPMNKAANSYFNCRVMECRLAAQVMAKRAGESFCLFGLWYIQILWNNYLYFFFLSVFWSFSFLPHLYHFLFMFHYSGCFIPFSAWVSPILFFIHLGFSILYDIFFFLFYVLPVSFLISPCFSFFLIIFIHVYSINHTHSHLSSCVCLSVSFLPVCV